MAYFQGSSLQVDLAAPAIDGRLPDIDIDGLILLIESLPFFDDWVDSLPPGAVDRDKRMWEGGFTRNGKQWQRDYRQGLQHGRRAVSTGDWSSLGVGAMATEHEDLSGLFWMYELDFGFATYDNTGEYMDRWGGIQLKLQSPGFPDAITEEWTLPLVEFMRSGAELVSALYGYGAVVADGASEPRSGYSRRSFGLPPHDPESVPGVQWISLLPPRVVDQLGGWDSVLTSAPVHTVEPIHYRDQRVGALAVAAKSPHEYDDPTRELLTSYLKPVLR